MPVSNLISKIAAGGLSAGVFLLWWPQHVRGDGLEELIVRGVLWSLLAELLILAFSPLENRGAALVRRWVSPTVLSFRDRLAGVPGRARTGGAVAMAFLGVAGPAALLVGAGNPVRPAAAKQRVVERVIVQKPVVRERVVVKRVWAEAATPLPPTTASAPATVTAPRPAARAATEKTANPAKKPAAQKPVPATTTTQAAPATQADTTTPAPSAGEPASAPVSPQPTS